jgi:hypothetical protein
MRELALFAGAGGGIEMRPTSRFKPDVRAHRTDYVTRLVPHAEASAFIRLHHYAKGTANTSCYAFGLFQAERMVGAALWMPPIKACARSVSPDWRRVLALSRMALEPLPTNAASHFLGAQMRFIRRDGRYVSLVTFADHAEGHVGTIYRATNWTYVGDTRPEQRFVCPVSMRLVSKKHGPKTLRIHEMEARYTKIAPSVKSKFVVHWSSMARGEPTR